MKSHKAYAQNEARARRPVASTLKLGRKFEQSDERGYTLVALLAVMAIILLLITAAAPSIRQQSQRSREEEAIARGEEVAEAIGQFVRRSRGKLPTSMEELLEGVPEGTKKIQVLRPSAAHDPLSSSGEWKLIHRTDAAFVNFARAVTAYAGGRAPATTNAAFLSVAGPAPVVTSILDTDTKTEAPGGEDDSENSSGPFIGVASRSQRTSVILYYDIERHDQWVFTPYFR